MNKIFGLSDLRKHKNLLINKNIFVFDLDGTLTKSKQALDATMAELLTKLLQKKRVVVIGGGSFQQFQKQFLRRLTPSGNLFVFPTNAAVFYGFDRGWKKIYENKLNNAEKKRIFQAFYKAFKDIDYKKPLSIYGRVLEDRGTQVTFSALGQRASLEAKIKWNKNQDVRPLLMKRLKKYLPKLEVRDGGLTSIDITRKGIDKAYGIRRMKNILRVPYSRIVFIGDALYPGGNDYAAAKSGVHCLRVSGPEETAKIIRFYLQNQL